ncbi:rep domain protein, partial [Escherichia coli 3-073-06_S3_C2]
MMSRAAEKNLRALQTANPAAALVFSVIRENMQIG